jgi:hypothetical protein
MSPIDLVRSFTAAAAAARLDDTEVGLGSSRFSTASAGALLGASSDGLAGSVRRV